MLKIKVLLLISIFFSGCYCSAADAQTPAENTEPIRIGTRGKTQGLRMVTSPATKDNRMLPIMAGTPVV